MLEQRYRYTDADLRRILEQASAYDCACPAQLCREIGNQRRLHAYQGRCVNRTDTDRAAHERIAAAAERCHAALEEALTDVLRLEGWDMERLDMPANLKKRLLAGIEPTG